MNDLILNTVCQATKALVPSVELPDMTETKRELPELVSVGRSVMVNGPQGQFNILDAEEAAEISRRCNSWNEVVEAARRLEVAANSVAYCYDRNPGNFAVALQSLRDDAQAFREALKKAEGK